MSQRVVCQQRLDVASLWGILQARLEEPTILQRKEPDNTNMPVHDALNILSQYELSLQLNLRAGVQRI